MRAVTTRILSLVIVLIVIAYHGLRLILSSCSGASCDAYSPLTLLLPIAGVVLAGITGGLAAYEARGRRPWAVLFAVCGVLAFAGPIVLALVLKDNDTKVWVSTVLVLTVPAAVGLFAAWRPSRIN
jgi:hypothetical protein